MFALELMRAAADEVLSKGRAANKTIQVFQINRKTA